MLPVKSHGFWSGQNPFKEQNSRTYNFGLTVAVITRATVRPSRLFAFWKAVPSASSAIENAEGVQYFKGIASGLLSNRLHLVFGIVLKMLRNLLIKTELTRTL